MKRSRDSVIVVAVMIGLLCCMAADWPQFRGPNSRGISDGQDVPTEWDSSGKNVLWKVEVPGFGASSPIVYKGRIYLTYYGGYGLDAESPGNIDMLEQHVACFNIDDGSEVFDHASKAEQPEKPYQRIHQLHGYASATPATDGDRLFTFFGISGVGAYSLDGKPIWKTKVGGGTHMFGTGASPALYKNLVIVNAIVEDGAVIALDKATGDEVWRAEGIERAWNTPLVVERRNGEAELIISGQGEMFSFDPLTGDELWKCSGIQDYVCPSVIEHEDIVYSIGGRKGMGVAVKLGGRGDVTETHRLWETGKGSNVSSPVYHDGYLYYVHEKNGIAFCIDASNGEVMYEERINPRPGLIYASPVLIDEKIYVVSRENGTYVIAAKPEYELLVHNERLDESVFNASPAVVDGRLLLRSDRFLYCVSAERASESKADGGAQ